MGDEYNGWTNFETWAVALWLDNDPGSQEHWREATRDAWEAARESKHVRDWKFSRDDAARILLAERLKEEVEEGIPLLDANLYADLLGAALSSVNWHEIARHYLADLDAETAEEDEAAEMVGRCEEG